MKQKQIELALISYLLEALPTENCLFKLYSFRLISVCSPPTTAHPKLYLHECWVSIMCQHRFMGCNNCSTLVGDIDKGQDMLPFEFY